jgi:hypothetical protein
VKWCPDCRRDLPLTSFTRNRRSRDGLSFYCAECGRARVIESRRRRLGPPRTRAGQGPRDVPEGMKWCPECDEVKPIADFPRNRAQRSGIGTYCKPCHNKIVHANKEKHGGRAIIIYVAGTALPSSTSTRCSPNRAACVPSVARRPPSTSTMITPPTGSADSSASTATARSASSAIAAT